MYHGVLFPAPFGLHKESPKTKKEKRKKLYTTNRLLHNVRKYIISNHIIHSVLSPRHSSATWRSPTVRQTATNPTTMEVVPMSFTEYTCFIFSGGGGGGPPTAQSSRRRSRLCLRVCLLFFFCEDTSEWAKCLKFTTSGASSRGWEPAML